jgi:hypothetical protein
MCRPKVRVYRTAGSRGRNLQVLVVLYKQDFLVLLRGDFWSHGGRTSLCPEGRG